MRAIFILLLAAITTSCAKLPVHYRSPEVSAIVVDGKTDKPMQGVTVIVSWKAIRRTDNPHNPDMMDIHSMTVITGTNGIFTIPAWGPVTVSSDWHYFSDDPSAGFSISGSKRYLGYVSNTTDPNFSDITPTPFTTVTFQPPNWNGQRIAR
jgi:hypothetical protein